VASSLPQRSLAAVASFRNPLTLKAMFADQVQGLDVPAAAKLVGIRQDRAADGAVEWTVTFRLPPLAGQLHQPRSRPPTPPVGGAADAEAAARLPRPAPLSDQQVAPVGFTASPPMPLAGIDRAQSRSVGTGLDQLALSRHTDAGSPTPDGHWPSSPFGFPRLPLRPNQQNRLFPLRCTVQKYMWGKFGCDSLVAAIAKNNDTDLTVTVEVPYAELWMGTHPSGPSMVMLQVPWRILTPLSDWLKLNPAMREMPRLKAPPPAAFPAGGGGGGGGGGGENGDGGGGSSTRLPFLFKVLSVRTALSIQAHPNKTLAAKLHREKPQHYKDDNHKPEMTIAVTPFEALCSFQKINSVLENCRACPELVAVVGREAVAALSAAAEKAAPLTPAWPTARWGRRGATARAGAERNSAKHAAPHSLPEGVSAAEAAARREAVVVPALKRVFTRLMTAEQALVKAQLDALMTRIESTSPMLRLPVDELAARIHEQYPHDVGVFCVYLLHHLVLEPSRNCLGTVWERSRYLLNYLVLEPGEALFLNANEPHAYLFGDCIECMAESDNVVRAGLTPKFKDVDVPCEMLTCDDGPRHLLDISQKCLGALRDAHLRRRPSLHGAPAADRRRRRAVHRAGARVPRGPGDGGGGWRRPPARVALRLDRGGGGGAREARGARPAAAAAWRWR